MARLMDSGCSKISFSMKWAKPPFSICSSSQDTDSTFFWISWSFRSVVRSSSRVRQTSSPSSR